MDTQVEAGNLLKGKTVFHVPLILSNPEHAIPYITVTLVAMILGLFGNTLIIVVFLKFKDLQKNGYEFMLNLAIADLLVTGVADPMCLIGAIGGEEFFSTRLWLCEAVAAACLTACICAFISLTSVTSIRYLVICRWNIFKKFCTKKTINIIMCILIWVVSCSLEMGNFLGWGDHYFDIKNHSCIWNRTKSLSYTYFVSLALIMCPLLFMTYCNIRIFMTILASKNRIKHHHNTMMVQSEVRHIRYQSWKEGAKASRSLIIVFIAFAICWLPYTILILIDMKDRLSFEVHLWFTWMAHLHSSINFIVYLVSYTKFRERLILLFSRQIQIPINQVIPQPSNSSLQRTPTRLQVNQEIEQDAEIESYI